MTNNPATNGVENIERAQRIALLRNFIDGKIQLPTPPPPPAYVPIGKTLTTLGITPIIKELDLDGEPTQCLCIPIHELVNHEWLALSGGINTDTAAHNVPPPTQ